MEGFCQAQKKGPKCRVMRIKARRGGFEPPWVKPIGLAIRRDGQAMRSPLASRRPIHSG